MKPAWNIEDLRAQAKRRLPRAIFEFLERGSENEFLAQHNQDALERIRMTPRTLRDVTGRDAAIELFGRKLPMPLAVGPTGTADLLCHGGESCIAAAAAEAGVPFTLATSSTTSMGRIAEITKHSGFWMQMYLWERRDLSWQVVDHAAALGAEALILTVDTPVWPNREFNKHNGMANPIRPNPTLALDFALNPVWLMRVLGRYMLTHGGLPKFANYPKEIGGRVTGPVNRVTNSASVNWDDVKELRRRWPNRLLLKGILSKDDAVLAADHGVDGVIVSNHGARNFDAAPASIEVLPEIVDAVAHRMAVIFDGGIRRGSHVLKAMAIGAHCTLVGRATLYGAAAGGKRGAARALEILREEIGTAMAMLGLNTMAELDRSILR
jgi:L-lactate dehydrogenase (cytochrome)/(S)-mandelate dehydrogenase